MNNGYCNLIVFCFLVVSLGCGSDHHGADLTALNQLSVRDGTTTLVELEHRFGPPYDQSDLKPDGTQDFLWCDGRREVVLLSARFTNRHFTATVKNGIVVHHKDDLEVPFDL